MTINPCKLCGHEMRLGAHRIRSNGKRGVAHYLAHLAGPGDCQAPNEFTSVMLKPYPKRDEDKAWFQMIQRWNELNPVQAHGEQP